MTISISSSATGPLVASTAIGLITVLGVLFYYKKHKNTLEIPSKWTAVGTVKDLIIYPLKHGRRLPIERATCTEVGMQMLENEDILPLRDRNYVIYREETHDYETSSKILLINVLATNRNQVVFDAPGMKMLKVTQPTDILENPIDTITILNGEKVRMRDCGEEAAKWVSKYILGKDQGLRLGFNENTCRRNIEGPYKNYLNTYPLMKNNASGLYSNITSYMLLTQASADDISSKVLDCDITLHNFRPNIVVDGTSPFAEDNWKWVKIGDVVLYMVKYCTRCAFVTIDPETSIRNKNYEPLKTMKTYRTLKDLKNIDYEGDSCVMGINMAMKQGGQIQVGDTVYVGEN